MNTNKSDTQAIQEYGDYYLTKRIAYGGMAELFRARRRAGIEGFEKILAIKRILPHLSNDRDFISMFINEAKIAAQLNHENIVHIFDFGKSQESYYLAMEYVWGKSFKAILARGGEQTVPVNLALYAIGRASMGLDYAHRKKGVDNESLNIIHRDISPQNILVSYEGEVKLVDFGIAKAVFQSSETKSGVFKGKIPYMSPEQVTGVAVDRRSDIFSLGIVLYELLTGQRLFQGESEFETIEKVKSCKIDPPSQHTTAIAKKIDSIVLKTLERDPEKRYQTGEELHDEVVRYLDEERAYLGPSDLRDYMQECFREEIRQEEAEIQDETGLVRRHEKVRIRKEIQAPQPASPSAGDGPTHRVPRLWKNLLRLGGVGILFLAAYGMLSLSPFKLEFRGKEPNTPDEPPPPVTSEEESFLLQNRINEASLLLAQGDFEGSIAVFDQVRSEDPQFAGQYDRPFSKAFLLRGKQNRDESPESALEDFRRACQMDPRSFEAHFEMGRLLTRMKKPREAILSYQKAIENNPELPDAHFNLGYLYFGKKAYLLAAEEFEAVVKLRPPYLKDAYFNLGLSYFRMEEKTKALRALKNALKLDPKNRRASNLIRRLGGS